MEKNKNSIDKTAVYLLGIESSGLTCAAGVSENGFLIANISANIKNIHSQKLASFVETILKVANLELQDISAIVLSAGPGSFTGLRIGYSLAKGLAHVLNIPIIEVPTLDVWAYQAGCQSVPVMPVIDARRGETFCAVYRWEENGVILENDYALLSPEQFLTFLQAKTIITGTDAPKLFPQLEKFLPQGSHLLKSAPQAPQIWSLLELGLQKYRQNLWSDLSNCEPFYMRPFKGVS